MNYSLITLFAITISISCFGTEEKKIESKQERKKVIIINHKGSVQRPTLSDNRYVSFRKNVYYSKSYKNHKNTTYDTKQETITLKDSNFEDYCIKIVEDKSNYCSIQ